MKQKIKNFFFFTWFTRWWLRIAAIFFVLALIIICAYLMYERKYGEKIYPGIFIGGIDVGGLTMGEAKNKLNQKIDLIYQKGIVFTFENNRASLLPLVSSVEGDLVYQLFDFNIEKNLSEAYLLGRDNTLIENLKTKFRIQQNNHYFLMHYALNDEEVNNFLKNNFSKFEHPPADAKLTNNQGRYLSTIKFSVEEERPGKTIQYADGIKELRHRLSILNDSPIKLEAKSENPKILKEDGLNIEIKAKKLLAKAPLSLSYKNDIWWVSFSKLSDWLILKPDTRASTTDDKIIIGLNYARVEEFINEWVAPTVNKEPVNAKFEIKDGRVMEFQVSADGQEIDMEDSVLKIESELTGLDANKIELVVKELKSELQTNEINDLGIKEIIGVGHSDFSGSPANRRHNINIGANALNGVLIKPGDEFSLIKTLGKIDASSGYKQELVIKDNKTIPEYGGGLCQIGTTIFRATLDTGLPVTMRRNHSYRVSYYEPAGTDATIYNPWPDYKFINDTENNILIQARIEGNDLYFDLWGTRDGREVKVSDPTIYNIVKPGPTRLIETLDLNVGEKKCTEHAHNGADAFFDYSVTYPNGDLKEVRFKSHYVPWREVCLIGVEKLSSEKTGTTTEETVD